MEVHLHVQPDNHIKCQLVRVSQHSKALQALGLQDKSPAKPSATEQDPQTAEAAAEASAEAPAVAEQQAAAPGSTVDEAQNADSAGLAHQDTAALQKMPSVPHSPFKSGLSEPKQQQQQQQQQQPDARQVVQPSAGESVAAVPRGPIQQLRTASSDMSPSVARARSSPRHHRCSAAAARAAVSPHCVALLTACEL